MRDRTWRSIPERRPPAGTRRADGTRAHRGGDSRPRCRLASSRIYARHSCVDRRDLDAARIHSPTAISILPICLWLVWRRRHELAAIAATPWWPRPGAARARPASLWFVAATGTVAVVQHYAIRADAQLLAALVAVVGPGSQRARRSRSLFLLFAVPFGEFLVPLLMDRTADFTVAALRLTRHSGLSRGQHFFIPSGDWSVVEACSGLRFLIASMMVGVDLRLSYLPQPRAARPVHRRVDRRADRRQLAARLHDRHDRPPVEHEVRGGRRSPGLRVGVLRRRDAAVLDRLILAEPSARTVDAREGW